MYTLWVTTGPNLQYTYAGGVRWKVTSHLGYPGGEKISGPHIRLTLGKFHRVGEM